MKWFLWMACFWLGCVAPKQTGVDPTLPEAVRAVEALAPHDVLLSGTQSEQPNIRARALALLILSAPKKAGDTYALQALGDPEPWVQNAAIEALFERISETETVERLFDYLERTDALASADVQGRAALRLLDVGYEDRLSSFKNRYQKYENQPWRASPWALLSAKMGNAEALTMLSSILSMADVPLEVDFFVALSRSGLASLVAALTEGQMHVEEELALTYALARLGLGDKSAESVFRAALDTADESTQIDAIELLSRIEGTERLLNKASSKPGIIGDIGDIARMPYALKSVDGLEKFAIHDDRFVRECAARMARIVHPLAVKNAKRVSRQVVKDTVQDADPMVQMEAIRTALAIGLTGIESELTTALTHELLSVRIEAAGALSMLHPTE